MLISEEELERRAAELRAKLEDWELGYLVGLVEGEASFDIRLDKKSERYYPRVDISNTRLDILCFFKNKLNIGHIFCACERGNSRDCYRWRMTGGNVLIFIKLIFNSLFSCKKIKAALLLSLNRENKGRYAELINKQIKYLNSCEEDLGLQPKRADGCFFENLTPFQLGLIAGLADGEGAIYISRRGEIYFEITNSCPRLISTLLKIIRGCGLRVEHFQRGRKIYRIRFCNQKARALLGKIKEFLMIKQKQAEVILEFAETIGGPGFHISPEIKKRREELYWRMRALNIRGRSYSGGPTALAPSIPVLPSPLKWSLPRSLSLLDA